MKTLLILTTAALAGCQTAGAFPPSRQEHGMSINTGRWTPSSYDLRAASAPRLDAR